RAVLATRARCKPLASAAAESPRTRSEWNDGIASTTQKGWTEMSDTPVSALSTQTPRRPRRGSHGCAKCRPLRAGAQLRRHALHTVASVHPRRRASPAEASGAYRMTTTGVYVQGDPDQVEATLTSPGRH